MNWGGGWRIRWWTKGVALPLIHFTVSVNLLKVITRCDGENIYVMRCPSLGEWDCVADGCELRTKAIDELAGKLGGREKDGIVLEL